MVHRASCAWRRSAKLVNHRPDPCFFCCGARVWCCDGFRMPAHRDGAAHAGAGVRKPPGKEGAGSGAPGSAGAMGIWRAPSVELRRYSASSSGADEHRHPFPAQSGIKSALVQGVWRPLPCAGRGSAQAPSLPAGSQQHDRSAVKSKTAATIIMTYRSGAQSWTRSVCCAAPSRQRTSR